MCESLFVVRICGQGGAHMCAEAGGEEGQLKTAARRATLVVRRAVLPGRSCPERAVQPRSGLPHSLPLPSVRSTL